MMEYRISLTGDLGSGKSTVSRIISNLHGCEIYSTGKICREKAAEMGIPDIKDMNIFMGTHPEIDKWIDDGLKMLSSHKGNLIVDSRMAWHFTANTFRVYLACEALVAAERIFGDNRASEAYSTPQETMRSNLERKQSENARYKTLYGVDIYDLTNYDLIVDTTSAKPEEVAAAVLDGCEAKAGGDRYFSGMLCPERLFPTSDTLDDGTPAVCSYKNNFYILSGHKAVMEAIRQKKSFVGCDIVPVGDSTLLDTYDGGDFPKWAAELDALNVRKYERV